MNYVCKEAGWYDIGNGEPKKVAYTDAEVLEFIKNNDLIGYKAMMVEVAKKVYEKNLGDVLYSILEGEYIPTYESLTPYALDYISERMYIDTGSMSAGVLELMWCEEGDEIEGD